MRMIPTDYVGQDKNIAVCQSQRTLRFAYAAYVAVGTKLNLINSQGSGALRQYVYVADGGSEVLLSDTKAICNPINGTLITDNSQLLNLATGLVTYLNAVTTGNIAFAIGGLQIAGFQDAAFNIRRYNNAAAVNLSTEIPLTAVATPLGGPGKTSEFFPILALNGSNQILAQDQTTAVVPATNTVCFCEAYGVLFGNFTPEYSGDLPVAGDFCDLYLNIF